MQRLKLFLIGIGFFWIFAWSVFGSILGAKINLIVVSGVYPAWLMGIEKSLLTAAHSHMNNMAITLIIFALTINQIYGFISKKSIYITCIINLLSVPIFGIGLLLEAFYPSIAGSLSVFTIISAIGAILYMITIGVWASFFMCAFLKKN